MFSQLLAAGLLVVSLALFLISTRQFALWLRVIFLLAASGALFCSGVIVAQMEGHYGLLRVVADWLAHWGDWENSVLVIALQRNEASSARHILPLLDMFLIVAALLGVLSVLALTPGEFIERFLRPLTFTLIGVMLGAGGALSVVAIGFGGPVDQRHYANLGRQQNAYDGDTFWLGETSLRLFGVDAPERSQPCMINSTCGQLAAEHLGRLLEGNLVSCEVKTGNSGNVTESFGRPLVQCEVRTNEGARFELGPQMIADGYAIAYRGDRDDTPQNYRDTEANAQSNLMLDCWVDPKIWRSRSARAIREHFRNRQFEEIPAEHLVGAGCP